MTLSTRYIDVARSEGLFVLLLLTYPTFLCQTTIVLYIYVDGDFFCGKLNALLLHSELEGGNGEKGHSYGHLR